MPLSNQTSAGGTSIPSGRSSTSIESTASVSRPPSTAPSDRVGPGVHRVPVEVEDGFDLDVPPPQVEHPAPHHCRSLAGLEARGHRPGPRRPGSAMRTAGGRAAAVAGSPRASPRPPGDATTSRSARAATAPRQCASSASSWGSRGLSHVPTRADVEPRCLGLAGRQRGLVGESEPEGTASGRASDPLPRPRARRPWWAAARTGRRAWPR